jgi:hypothetical protein
MGNGVNTCLNNEKSNELNKLIFSSAISDRATYIQLIGVEIL